MTYTVKYRTNSGSIAEKTVEAASRSDCFANCKALGIVPLGVEGKKSEDADSKRIRKTQHTPFKSKPIIFLTALAILGVVVWIWTDAKTAEEPKAATKKAARSQTANTKKEKVNVEKSPSERKESEKPVLQEEKKKPTYDPDFQANYPRKPGHLPLPGGNVITFKPPAPGCTAQVFTVNGLYLCDAEGNFTKYEPPLLFDNRFENTLDNLAMNTQILLTDHTKNFTDAEINKYLSRPITIEANDPPDVVLRKTATAAMKDDIREFLKQGGTYAEYIDSLHNKIGSERVLHREAMREMITLLSEGDYEGAREYREKIDSFLSESGYLGLKLPDEWQRQLDENVVSIQQEQ
jgi:hypothetical protein